MTVQSMMIRVAMLLERVDMATSWLRRLRCAQPEFADIHACPASKQKAPADARASKLPILKRARSAGWEKFVARLRKCQATSATKTPSIRRIFSDSVNASLIISSNVRSTPLFHLQ